MFKGSPRLSILGAGMLAGLALLPSQAAAAPLAVSLQGAMPLAAIATTKAACLPGASQLTAAQPRAITTPTPAAVMSKSSAILGGQMSALDRMKMQQSGAAIVQNTSASMAGTLPAVSAALPMAAVGFNCPAATEASETVSASAAVLPAAGQFLGTERVKIGTTRFDRDWKRVARKSVSQRELSKAIGAVPDKREDLLGKVNRWVNRAIEYRSDRGGDNWADARTTLSKRAGDCEDYAILKLQMLAAAGVSKDDMMLTLARDTLRRVDHAVLLVKHEEQWVMLDMQSDRVAPASTDYGYKPVMSFAGNASFLHGKKYQDPTEAAPLRLALAE